MKELAQEKLKREKLKTTALAEAAKKLEEKRIINEKEKKTIQLASWEKKVSLQESTQKKLTDEKIKVRHEQIQMQKGLLDLKKTLTLKRESNQRQQQLQREAEKARKAEEREKERHRRQKIKDEESKTRRLKQQEARDEKEALRTKTARLRAELQEKKIQLASAKIEHQNHELEMQKPDDYDEDHVEQMVQAIAQDRKVLAEEKTDFKTVGGILFKKWVEHQTRPLKSIVFDPILYTNVTS